MAKTAIYECMYHCIQIIVNTWKLSSRSVLLNIIIHFGNLYCYLKTPDGKLVNISTKIHVLLDHLAEFCETKGKWLWILKILNHYFLKFVRISRLKMKNILILNQVNRRLRENLTLRNQYFMTKFLCLTQVWI